MLKGKQMVFLVIAGCFLLSSADLVRAIEPASFEETSGGGLVETIEGSIDSIDAEKNIVTVRWMNDPVMMHYENITLKVLPSTALIKNSDPIKLRDIEAGDHASVRYDPYAVPLARAVSIDIEE